MNSDVNARAGARSRLGSTVSDESALAVPTTRKSRLSSTASSTSGGPTKETKNPYKYSLAIVGSCGVGKTCLTAQFASADAVFYKDYNPTVEDSYDLTRRVGEEDMRIHLIDTAGSEEMKALRPKYMAKCDGFILVYSVEDLGSFQELADFVQQIRQVKGKSCVPMVLVGNKGDSRECAVPGPLAQQLASELHCELVITSAKWGDNVESIFAKLLQRLEYLNAPELTGWLTKKGGGTRNLGRKSWRRRWFRLRGDSLAYYKSETDKRPIRSIPISSIQRVQTDKDNELRFIVMTRTRDYEIDANTLDEMHVWVIRLRLLIQQ